MREETEAEAFEKLQAILRNLKEFVDDHTQEGRSLRFDCYNALDSLRGELCRRLFELQ